MTVNHIINHISQYLIIILSTLALLCGCGEETPAFEGEDMPNGIISIAHLKTMATSDSRIITEDISIEGYVVVNDLYGEYYKSIVICDKSGGIEISVDTNSTARTFPVAAKVTVHCTSLTLGNYAGRIILGAKSFDYVVGRIAESDFTRYFSIDKLSPQAIEPTQISIAEIAPQHVGNYVEIADVTFNEGGKVKWCDTDTETKEFITTERIICDKQGDSLAVRTIAQCSYASEMLPTGRGRIRGIIEKYNNRYSLRVVNRQFDFRE